MAETVQKIWVYRTGKNLGTTCSPVACSYFQMDDLEFQVTKNGNLATVGADATKETCGGRCGAEQCALCRGDADTDNKQNIVSTDLDDCNSRVSSFLTSAFT